MGDRPPLAGHAAHRQPPAAPGPRLRRGARRRHHRRRRRPQAGLAVFGVDERGLDKVDRAILVGALRAVRRRAGRAVARWPSRVGEQPETVEDVYEPFLIQQGLLARTPRGRVAMPAAYEHLGLDPAARRPAGAARPVRLSPPAPSASLARRAPGGLRLRPADRRASPRRRSSRATRPACSSTAGPRRRPSIATSATCPALLRRGDLVVVNDTRVIPARLRLRRATGGAAEVLLLEPLDADAAHVGGAGAPGRASCAPASTLFGRDGRAGGRGRRPHRGRRHVRRSTLARRRRRRSALLDEHRRDAAAAVHPRRRSPTPSATRPCTPRGPGRPPRRPPACTSPPSVLAGLAADGRRRRAASSWSSASTRSSRSPRTTRRSTAMHSERYRVPADDAGRRATARRGAVVAVGTTTRAGPRDARPRPAQLGGPHRPVHPPRRRRSQVVDVLMTNFHLPRTTLLMMIDAFVGPRWRDLYADGAGRRATASCRFGDAMLARRTPRTPHGACGPTSTSRPTDGAARAGVATPPAARTARRASCRSAPAARSST